MTGRRWDMHAQRFDNGAFHSIGDHWYAKMHGGKPVPVTVTEDPQGNMLGWIDTGDEVPVMIQHEKIFEVQFTYGSKVEVERGKGTIVRLTVEAADHG